MHAHSGQILERMPADSDPSPAEDTLLLADLRKLIAKRKVIVVVGSGVSTAVSGGNRWASWQGLLSSGVDRILEVVPALSREWGDRVHQDIYSNDIGDVLSAAEKISTKLDAPHGGEFKRWLRETVGELHPQNPTLIAAISQLGCPIATTNYDALLENCTGLAPATWTDSSRVDRFVRDEAESIFHIHGHWEFPESVVLGIRSYERLLANDHAQSIARAIGTTRSFLFIGCGQGLVDPDFAALRKWMRAAFSASEHRHFFLGRSTDEPLSRHAQLPADRIFFIPYGTSYDHLAPFLGNLRSANGSNRSGTTTNAGETTRDNRTESPPTHSRAHGLLEHRCDVPPHRSAWVGREAELRHLENAAFTTIAVTGIGGQGKSVLAAEHLSRATKQNKYTEWDWRDCREEGDTLLTHFVRILERFGGNALSPRDLVGASPEDLAPAVASLISEAPRLFVFDNVDHYVNLETNRLSGALEALVSAVLRQPGHGRLIFTCRPKIHYEASTFLHLPLGPFSAADSLRLFEARGNTATDPVTRSQIQRACSVTGGHPLRLNLLAVQLATQNTPLDALLDKIEQGQSTNFPKQTLEAIWATLKDQQRTLLRLMAEAVRPEPEEHLGELASQEMSWHRFTKALKAIKTLDLVVTKSSPGTAELLELHPIIREYIRTTYPRRDRSRFISRLVAVIDAAIAKLRPQLKGVAAFSLLDRWTQRTELLLNNGQHPEALDTLLEIHQALLTNGYIEEFTRVALRLFSEISWANAITSEYRGFDETLVELASALSHLGRGQEADALLDRYEEAIGSKGNRYIALCSARCYSLWYRGKFSEAVLWGSRGVELKSSSSMDTIHDCSHNLALAQRDSGNAELAMQGFLKQRSLDELLATPEDGALVDGSVFGNVGRCLWKMGRVDDALACYRRSARSLETSDHSHSLLNRGYIRLWIGEALALRGEYELARCFFRAAHLKWTRVSPPRATEALDACGRIERSPDVPAFSDSPASLEARCRNWILAD
jgi:tetratricopeptide (TPR) repeat protein